jgi:hypothetical protein
MPTDYGRLLVFGAIWTVIAGATAVFLLLNAEQRAVISRKLTALRAGYRVPAYSRK